jgi:hypothetical protein
MNHRSMQLNLSSMLERRYASSAPPSPVEAIINKYIDSGVDGVLLL